MEVVEFSGYTDREKLHIARRYLLPRQLTDNGLDGERLAVTDEAIAESIAAYTREAGVRQLERELGKLARKVARRIAGGEITSLSVDVEGVRDILGRPKVHPEHAAESDQVGVATGMYYTPAGGDIMFVEASTMRGKGDLLLTGQLGDVMKEADRRRDVRAGHPHPRPGRRGTQGRPVSGYRHGDSGGIGPVGLAGAPRHRHDRGDHSAGTCPAHRRSQGKGDTLEVHLVDELGEALALTMRGATLREGRLLFADERADGGDGVSARLAG